MSYRWAPNKSERKAFAERMKDPIEQAAYNERKEKKVIERRSHSKFNYGSAGGQYTPTQYQHNFCFDNMHLFITSEEEDAANMVMTGFVCQMKVDHDSIHIVNEKIRNQSNL